jgi:hypothetical protein
MILFPRPDPRFVRPRFSLRMLLLFMLMLAISLAIFRWSWEETTVRKDDVRTTTFRRGWNGRPLKHGPERTVTHAQQLNSAAFYDEGALRLQKEYDPSGNLRRVKQLFPEEGRELEKEYVESPSGTIICESEMFQSQGRYRYRWTTLDGELLESQAYQHDAANKTTRLTHWNGLPIEEAMAKFTAALPDEPTRQSWLQKRRANGATTIADLGDTTLQLRPFTGAPVGTVAPQADQLLFHIANIDSGKRAGELEVFFVIQSIMLMGSREPANKSLLEQILRDFASSNATLRCRYGIVCLVPIDKQTLAEDDLAGVLQVTFTAGSEQEKDWLQLARAMPTKISAHADTVQEFLEGASFEFDVSQMQGVEPPQVSNNEATLVNFERPTPDEILRPRRDILGIFLWRNNYCVKQEGNKLIFLPREK